MVARDFILNLHAKELVDDLKSDKKAMKEIEYQVARILESYNIDLDFVGNVVITSKTGGGISFTEEPIISSKGKEVGMTLLFEPKDEVSFSDPTFSNRYRLTFIMESSRIYGLKLRFDIKRIEKTNDGLYITNIYNRNNNHTSCDSVVRYYTDHAVERAEEKQHYFTMLNEARMALYNEKYGIQTNPIEEIDNEVNFKEVLSLLYNVRRKGKPEYLPLYDDRFDPYYLDNKTLGNPEFSKSVHVESNKVKDMTFFEVTTYDIKPSNKKSEFESRKYLFPSNGLANKHSIFNVKTFTSVASLWMDTRYIEDKSKTYNDKEKGKVYYK